MWEIWWQSGRTRKVVARFRLLKDAEKYISKHAAEEGTFEMVEADPYGQGSGPPSSQRSRSWSGVRASEHPDEFIADRLQQDKVGNSDSD